MKKPCNLVDTVKNYHTLIAIHLPTEDKVWTEERRLLGSIFLSTRESKPTLHGKSFLLIRKHFPKKQKLPKIFNKNTVQVSFSCIQNIANIIRMYYRKFIDIGSNNTKIFVITVNTELGQKFPQSILFAALHISATTAVSSCQERYRYKLICYKCQPVSFL